MEEILIEVKGLKKGYKKRKTKEWVQAVNDVNFTVKRGEILGLLGPNGAGKTTTIKMICGLIVPDEGEVVINGITMQKNRLKGLEHISAVLEGNRNLYWRLTARENLEYFAGNRGNSRKEKASEIEELLHEFKLKQKENELVSNLSRGMQQKLALAVALLADSDVILLDEPTLGLDIETGYEVRQLLKKISEAGKTIIISTHDMPVVQDLCERTVIINDGKVIADEKVEELMNLFETSAYVLTLGNELTEQQQKELDVKFPMNELLDGMKLTITLEQDNDIYDLMDLLKKENTIIEKIDRTTINFEEVFMNLIQEEKNHAIHSIN
ncbi:ABC transporter ATP-binding protein [Allobacillus halotolerans]|uniref:ABC transporter ATP-binding protein n=1 Tax=Allobacillus halotolerans TaxID=570278 RepID=A0ABS6GRU6_9BACI|nr:ABC transporter ATP-binding protein [Allobacillus halotolerans]MBU6081611.1 ABC transporter ATP-binding protein [Allobacillus halotolerans]